VAYSEESGGIAYQEKTRYIISMNPQHIGPIEIKAAVITVSTTRTENTDTSGQLIRDLLGAAGIPVISYGIVPDTIGEIRGALVTALHEANCVIINGGTGLTHDDCTIEAVAPLLEKRIDGFGELFRLKSYEEIGTPAILSRALAGVCQHGVVFCIPGSNAAVLLATETLIIPEIRHILTHAAR
jgi:molybdenum cofactor biosynthesis protein B